MSKIAIFIIGPPGSGKSTIAQYLADKLDFKRISGGDILRKISSDASHPKSKMISELLYQGFGIDDDVIIEAYSNQISLSGDKFVFDGNTNSRNQAEKIFKLLSDSKIYTVVSIQLVCSETVALRRIKDRNEKRDSLLTEALANRFRWYNEKVIAAISVFERKSELFIKIDASESLDKVISTILTNVILKVYL